MKKKFVLFLLLPLCLCSCKDQWYYADYYVPTIGFNNQSTVYAYDHGQRVIVAPFDTTIFIRDYTTMQRNNITLKEEMTHIFHSLHAQFDSHFDYLSSEGEEIHNLKEINDFLTEEKEIQIEPELFELLKYSLEWTSLTNGAFHLGIGSLTSLWDSYIEEGSNTANGISTLPTQEQVTQALSSIPSAEELSEIIHLNEDNSSVLLTPNEKYPELSLSLGAVGKGYTTKKMEESLEPNFVGYISSGESSITTVGENPFGGWTLALTNPLFGEYQKYHEDKNPYNAYELLLKKQGGFSFSTSGDYQRFYYDENNKRHHHILDSKTGYSNKHYRCVSVLSDDALIADMTTTALMNLTKEEGISLIQKLEEQYSITISPIWMEQVDNKIIAYADELLSDELVLNEDIQYKNNTTLEFIKDIHK